MRHPATDRSILFEPKSLLASQFAVKPGPGERPMPLGCGLGNSKRLGSLWQGQAGKKTQLNQRGSLGMLPGEFLQSFIDAEQRRGIRLAGELDIVQIDPLPFA